MSEFSLHHWLVVLVLTIVLWHGRRIVDIMRDLGGRLGGGGRGGPAHPLQVTGTVETSRGSANPKESKSSL